jgi:hypothetical protein
MSREFPIRFEPVSIISPEGATSQDPDTAVLQQSLETAKIHAQKRPIVVTLCGSTRFTEDTEQAMKEETLAGRIVLSIGYDPNSLEARVLEPLSVETRIMMDELHLRKIDLSDEILVINKGGYIGESTKREIQYATDNGKTVRYMEQGFWNRVSKAAGKINPRRTQGK